MASWYLAALRATEQMARHVGEDGFAEECARLYGNGRCWVDANLFTGRYYRHNTQPPARPARPRLGRGADDVDPEREPDLQLGGDCLVDQVVGQLAAHLTGLGYVLAPTTYGPPCARSAR